MQDDDSGANEENGHEGDAAHPKGQVRRSEQAKDIKYYHKAPETHSIVSEHIR